MSLNIKVTPDEHSFACSNECVYGLVNGSSDMYTYVELGEEDINYLPSAKKDIREDRKRFTNCKAYFATTEERLEKGIFEKQNYEGAVVIYK